jgi:hypothetical protein
MRLDETNASQCSLSNDTIAYNYAVLCCGCLPVGALLYTHAVLQQRARGWSVGLDISHASSDHTSRRLLRIAVQYRQSRPGLY